jgi:hypothetical protein
MLRNLGLDVEGLPSCDQLSLQAPFPEGLAEPMARQLAPGSCVRRILQKEVWLWAGNKWDVL